MFKFSLQTALDVRARQEKIRMKELAEKIAVQQSIQTEIDGIHNNLTTQDGQQDESKKAGRIDIMQMRMMQNFKNKSKLDLGKLGDKIEFAGQEVEEKRQNLVDASRLRKTLEILREKEKTKYIKWIGGLEQEMLDEVGGNIYFKNMQGGA